ncbi:Urease accessory protein UreG [Sporomusa ovata DSM 2662]|uniref:Ni2+-binding GTPase involved in regulation of expression and maturation of hydrogenase n=1 Tax=Sporomusa ovata TaxID=2378 RepID=A0A0U1L1K7_9FIRM|nr:GTP-binding protein [Sporomusa ovata]EQB27572.1 Ni2+-binding GTPase, urease/hydrogenase maturation protein [Sporomusa ovata DSM 2662]CQR73425.1 Ni2+-binding GTPase involved in regulation of expression and maturation of hydrogenase [Sporomusa ovata]
MKLITVSGAPSSGKTSVILRLIDCLRESSQEVGVIKFDCLTSFDQLLYKEYGVQVQVGFSGKFCPDHFFISNIEDAVEWGNRAGLDILISESAGLCNRCSPHIQGVLAICVIDNLSGINTPRKIGPMLKLADIVLITKGDIVSQAEREVFMFNVRQVNPGASILFVNGITGQGAFMLSKHVKNAADITTVRNRRLRFSMPASVCAYCTGETRIGETYQMGMLKKMEFR